LSSNINTIKKTDTITDANMNTGIEVNTEETKYMLMPLH